MTPTIALWLLLFLVNLASFASATAKMGIITRSGTRRIAALECSNAGRSKPTVDKRKRSAPACPKKLRICTKEESEGPKISSPPKLLLTLDPDCVPAQLICRPSKRNKSPYVADIFVPSLNRQAICHVPNLDMGGKCIPGVQLLVKPQKDKHGVLLGPHAMNPKYNTPKCEFACQLLLCDETALSANYIPTWVGAHPTLGESIAKELLNQNELLFNQLPPIASFKSQVGSINGNMRPDFVVEHTNGRKRIVEVKTVVDTDYSVHWPLPDRTKCVYTSDDSTYMRTALFPWGNSKQIGPDGETVVSARAIKHVMEITKLVETGEYDATILFVVIRGDAKRFRPNHQACPSFAKYLKNSQEKGVQLLVKQVKWGATGVDVGKCFDHGWIDIEWPA